MPLNRESDRQNVHQVYYCTSKKIYEHEDMIERAATKKKKTTSENAILQFKLYHPYFYKKKKKQLCYF